MDLNTICYSLASEGVMFERALTECDAALKLKPDNAAILDSRAFVLMRMGHNPEALSAYNAALLANPKETNSLYGRGLVEARLGRSVDSARDTASALAIRPQTKADFEEMGVR